ncbi:lipoprotein N-acyltransferase Lnb domain-containing protein [Aquimarina agarivorans]|uniref:lipoprotein N-acyltransferase Lnb domain-containing protein n=1 Tax=Aquimarina agarivorans TaxID=980584 RepID=UPI000248EF91|nr:DUF4105 domain-containing protein [Aquimarina agarivorans]
MKKQIFILISALFVVFAATAQKETKISLLTFATGFESHSIFGHTALRVQNTLENTDIVYNFGIFDFDTPYFLAKFAGGRLDYKLGIEDFERMLLTYKYYNRQVFEQELNLTQKQKKAVLTHLEYLYRPENRYYRYGFLRKNCSTELRDIFISEIENVTYTPTATNKTYRSYLNDYAKVVPWFKFGINLALGSTIDKKINTAELMFLPDYLSEELEKATVNNKPLAQKQKKLLPNLETKKASPWKITPLIFFCFLFVLLILGRSKVLIQTFTMAIAIAGTIIFVISMFSAHPEVQKNYNLLWCNPLYLVSFILCFTQHKKVHKTFATIMLLGILATFGVWFSNIQGYDLAFIPICATLFWINLKQMQRR